MSAKVRGIPQWFHVPGGNDALISDFRKGPPKDSPAVRRALILGHTLTESEYYEMEALCLTS